MMFVKSWASALKQRFNDGQFTTIWIATVLLFIIGGVVAPNSLSQSSLLSMLPYAAILAVIAAGQTLVAQQAGIDLSVPAVVSLGALFVTKLPSGAPNLIIPAIAAAIASGAFVGAINGVLVSVGRLTAIVATIGVNSLVLGYIQWYSKGFPTPAEDVLGALTAGNVLGVPTIVVAAIVVVAIVHLAVSITVVGRRFEAVGANAAAAAAARIPVQPYVIAGYAGAGACYAIGGVLLASYLKTPTIFAGETYLLPSVAAVVLGGTALSGGVGSVVASGVAAVFLTQLGQLVLTLGASSSVQWIIQAVAIAIGMAWRQLNIGALVARLWPRRPSGILS